MVECRAMVIVCEMTQEARWGLVVRGLEVHTEKFWNQSIHNEGLYV